jgi:PP-loop superfamily ATP-utilizing enzyme
LTPPRFEDSIDYVASTLDQLKTALRWCEETPVAGSGVADSVRLTKVAHGVLGDEALRMIEVAENLLRDAGFDEVRVRHHQNRGVGATARMKFRSNYRRTE